jgi:uncharacterized protein YjiS (DUF1127 family)
MMVPASDTTLCPSNSAFPPTLAQTRARQKTVALIVAPMAKEVAMSSVIDEFYVPPRPRRAFSIRALFGALARSARHWLARHAEAVAGERALFQMPDHLLKDIGLSRCEVSYAIRHGREGLEA